MDVKTRFEALSQSAFLDVHLPKTSDFNAGALIRDGFPDDISRAPARRNLFFDEQASLLVVLKTSASEHEVRDILPNIELVLGAHATDAVPQGSGNAASAQGKHDLGSKSFPGSSYVDFVATEGRTYVIWKPTLHLSRPRARLQRPAIYFTANVTISSGGKGMSSVGQKEYLKSFEPLPSNVLEPLQFDPALHGSQVSLPESRITKVAPKATHLKDAVKPIRGASKRAFPAVPAIFSKIRYSALPDAMIASLHLETSHIIAGTVTITAVDLDVPQTKVEHLTNVALPLDTRGGDETIILYKLTALGSEKVSAGAAAAPASIAISAEATLDQGSNIKFSINWQAQVDLSQTLPKPVYRWSRPLSTMSGHHRGLSTQSNPSVATMETPPKANEGVASGITFTFSAPATAYKNAELKLNVHCNNRSGRTRRFGLMMLRPRKTRTTTMSQATTVDADLIANIFNAPLLERTKSPDVHDLNPDVRIGPLPTGACFEAHLRFRILKTGVLDLGVLRILDLDTRQTVDVRELPDVVALEAVDEEV
ncbi:hypothetical protein PRZ48_001431 [Zasmidium cellare]|uniref:Trafficking protein particle complex II-specific subunit 65 IgD3 domain-containing protein n=1 Tax=Zasmidium cellare TaxID=395010 RepID=A0ABR0F2X2_ZASCE|nr:hypothetical protein PRZ48_001431 [Zasmidium cellare]